MSKYISFIALLVVLVLLVILFYKVMAGFFIPLFLAALLVVIFRPLHRWMVEKCKGRHQIAALLTTISVLLTVLIPLSALFVLAAFESQQLIKTFNKASLMQAFQDTRQKLNLTLPEISNELKSVEIQLDNIAEMERYEDIVNMGWQFRTTKLYNEDLIGKIESDSSVQPYWDEFAQAFDQLSSIQEKIAYPFDTEEIELSENDLDKAFGIQDKDTAELLHDFQQQLIETQLAFSDLKVQVLGGNAFWVWVRESANPTTEQLEEYGAGIFGLAQSFLVGIGKTTTTFLFKIIFGLVIMIISLYFFLMDGPAMLTSLKKLSPIDDQHEQELVEEFGNVSRAVVVATLAAALVQAILGGIGYYFAGLQSVFLLTLLTGCFALVPFFGAAGVWVPCVLWLFFVENNTSASIGLGLFGVVISSSDNFIKPLILHGQSKLHPLFALLSILGGVAALGPIGILIGPMVVAFLQTLLKIVQRELESLDQSSRNDSSPSNRSSALNTGNLHVNAALLRQISQKKPTPRTRP